MRHWSSKSQSVLNTLDPKLQIVCNDLLEWTDVSLTCGFRDAATQNRLFEEGKTKVRWPNSKHNNSPSRAVDLQPHPYPDNENDLRAALGYIAGLAMMIAHKYGIKLRWGGDWNRNGSVVDNGFDDLYHLELLD